jgi:pilus assembly protein FimV
MHSVDHPHPTRQRGPHNDPSMLDGDSAHGNPGDLAGDEWAVDTDTDVVDQAAEDELDDAVADPAPDSEDETEEVDAELEPRVEADWSATEEDEPAEPEAEVEAEDEPEAVDGDEEEDEEDEEDSVTEPAADATSLEDELGRQMDRTSTDPEHPAHHPPPAHEAAPPIDGYDALTVPQVLERADGLDAGRLNAVLEYEKANRNRKTLVAKLARLTRDA